MEKDFAEIWQALLNLGAVGVNDNFFELGGDSILSIQVVSRARKLGYKLQPKDLFIYQSIGRLCTAIKDRSDATILSEQGTLTGMSGLLPIQQWYLNSEPTDMSHFNQTVFLKTDKGLEITILNQAIEKIISHHDALRFRYFKEKEIWHQEYGHLKSEVILERINSKNFEQQNLLIEEVSEKYQRSLDIEKGELIRIVLLKTPNTEKHNRLLIVIHHLAVDGISWRILIEDIELLLNGIVAGDEVNLGYKTSSYRQWFNALENYGKDPKVLSQKRYWQDIAKGYSPLKVDKEYNGLLRIKDTDKHTQQLTADQTRNLLQEVSRVYHTEINDILLCALAITLCEWANINNIIIGLEGHGREEIADGVDISRTVGWFTNLYPILLEIKTSNNNPDELIKSVKEQLRRVPDKGIGYGVLKYINKETTLQGEEPWDVIFNYLGQVDNVVKESKWFSGASEYAGARRSNELAVSEKLSVNSIVSGGELIISWTFSTKHYNIETVKDIASKYVFTLETLIAHCLQRKNQGAVYTPSDYGLGSEISYEELDHFLNESL